MNLILTTLLVIFSLGFLKQTSYLKVNPKTTPTPVVKNPQSNIAALRTDILVTPTRSSPSLSIEKFIYPVAIPISSGKYSSTDSPDIITNWYTSKITSLGFSSKSFIKTSTNGQILNKLTGSQKGSLISVEISKSPQDKNTYITIVLDN